jgi:hypothetical protein
MQCCGAIYHLVDPKIDKNRQNPQNTCSKIPGRVFSEVAEAPQAARTQTHRAGRPETGNKCQYLVDSFYISKNVDFSKCQN